MGVKITRSNRKQAFLSQKSAPERVGEWVENNSRAAVGAGVAIVLAALLVGGFVVHERSKDARALAEYGAIASRIPGDTAGSGAAWKTVLPELSGFIEKHADSPATLNAKMELARGYFATKNYAQAAQAGESALKIVSANSSVKPLILYQLGYSYESAGKPDEAAKTFMALKKVGAPALERDADWNLGMIFQAKKNFSKAAVMYELAYRAPGDYPSAPQIEERLSAIKSVRGK
ncbi:MAG: tetratricopeptide repeat protein [Syntrophobacteraceae bacterium]|nr:tetratricopeptide repeat protein [Syntrophobacteraceae bacterium]